MPESSWHWSITCWVCMNSERLVFGVGGIHRLVLRSQRARLLQKAFALGFRSCDMAPAYSNGLNELELGQALQSVCGEVRITPKSGTPSSCMASDIRQLVFCFASSRRSPISIMGLSMGEEILLRPPWRSKVRRFAPAHGHGLCRRVIDPRTVTIRHYWRWNR